MTGPVAAMLPCGSRLHLQHGPIDLVIGADGDREAAFAAAHRRFSTMLEELVAELPLLRREVGPRVPVGETAQKMWRAARACDGCGFVTPMIAVAGAVAQTVLAAMVAGADLTRAYVNNGGDIALHLGPGARFATAMARADGSDLGRIALRHGQGVGGIATSGRHGRSLSLGIADSVTVMAATAAEADAAATLIANAVDLPGHPTIARTAARDLHPDSDLGHRPVVTGCGPLTAAERIRALEAGLARADDLRTRGLITAAALFLGPDARTTGPADLLTTDTASRTLAHA